MARLTSILLVTLFAAISSGGMTYLHEMQEHQHPARAGRVSFTAADEDHDEATCQVCATLHMPALAGGFVPLLICLGLFVAFLTQLSPSLVSQHRPLSFNCRGPPAI